MNNFVYRMLKHATRWLIQRDDRYNIIQREHFLCAESWVMANDLTRPTCRLPFNGAEWHLHCTAWGWIGVCPGGKTVVFRPSYGELVETLSTLPGAEAVA